MKQEVIITNNNLLVHFSGHNKDLLVLKQWKGALNRIMPRFPAFLILGAQALSHRYSVKLCFPVVEQT